MEVQKLCCKIVGLGNWTALMVWSKVNHSFRCAAQMTIRLNIHWVMTPFFPECDLLLFWRLLAETNACILGGIVWCIIMAMDTNYEDALPNQLNIILPSTVTNTVAPMELWKQFLHTQLYLADFSPFYIEPYDHCTKEVVTFTKLVCNFNTTFTISRL